jgi:hypothetical protein
MQKSEAPTRARSEHQLAATLARRGSFVLFGIDTPRRTGAESDMKIRTTVLALLISAVAASLCLAADDAFMGTWKLNESKSKIPAGAHKNTTVVYAQSGDEVTITVDGVDPEGKSVHHVWTGKMDGKEYAAKGSAMHDSRAYKKVDARTVTYTVMKNGKKVGHGKVVVAADGKSRTVTETDTGADGKQLSSKSVYDKE